MKLSNKVVSKFQEGGAMPAGDPAAQGAPAGGDPAAQGGGGQDPVMQIAQMAGQALQTQDCQTALAVCEAFMSLVQGGGQGGDPAAQGGDPAAQEGAPVYKRGGRLVKRVKA